MTGGGGEGGGVSAVGEYCSGATAGAASVLAGHPFDTVKVLLQAPGAPYRNTLHCVTSVVSNQGPRVLYRGVQPPLLGGAAESGVNYLVYARTLAALKERDDEGERRFWHIPVASAAAGLALSPLLGPTELLKCRMQASGAHTSTLECARGLLREEGMRGLMRGMGSTMAREVPGNSIAFTTYESVRGALPAPRDRDLGAARPVSAWIEDVSAAIVSGAIAGGVFWTTIMPIDAAKTRIQLARPGTPGDVSLMTTLRRMAAEPGGVRNWYRGLTPTLARAVPANAAQWLAWELSMHMWAPSDASPEETVITPVTVQEPEALNQVAQ